MRDCRLGTNAACEFQALSAGAWRKPPAAGTPMAAAWKATASGHDEYGNKKPNFALILGVFASSGLANAYYPRDNRGLGDTAARAGSGMLGTAEMNLLREFLPDIKRNSKHEPKRLQKLEQSPRVEKIEQMMLGPVALPPCPAGEKPPGKTGNN